MNLARSLNLEDQINIIMNSPKSTVVLLRSAQQGLLVITWEPQCFERRPVASEFGLRWSKKHALGFEFCQRHMFAGRILHLRTSAHFAILATTIACTTSHFSVLGVQDNLAPRVHTRALLCPVGDGAEAMSGLRPRTS